MRNWVAHNKKSFFTEILSFFNGIKTNAFLMALFFPVLIFLHQFPVSHYGQGHGKRGWIFSAPNQNIVSSVVYHPQAEFQHQEASYPCTNKRACLTDNEETENEEVLSVSLIKDVHHFLYALGSGLAWGFLHFNLLSPHFYDQGKSPDQPAHKIYLLIQVFRI